VNNAAINSALLLDPTGRHHHDFVDNSSIKTHCETSSRGRLVRGSASITGGGIDLPNWSARSADTRSCRYVGKQRAGVLSPIEEIAALAKKRVLFHTDAVQAVGKSRRARALAHHFLALSGTSCTAERRGALYVSKRTKFIRSCSVAARKRENAPARKRRVDRRAGKASDSRANS